MSDSGTLNAANFTARCLDLMDQVNAGHIGPLVVTKRPRPVAVISAPNISVAAAYGALRGSVAIPDGFDLTAPVLDEPKDAAAGLVLR